MPLPILHVRILALVFAVLASPSLVRADNVDDYIRVRMEKEHLPGLSLAVVKDGKVVKLKGYGSADLELAVPASPRTAYQVGSITKQFTAAAILILVQERRLGLDDKVGKYIEGTPDAWKDITLRNLLTHTSGLNDGIRPADETMFADFTEAEMLTSAMSQPPRSPPGVKYVYGNFEYDLLAMIVEKVSGKSFGAFLQDRIFGPLGMTSSRINDRRAIIANRASGYTWTGGHLEKCEPQVSPTLYIGSGSMISTVEDLARWDAALYSDTILTAASRQAMWTAARLADGTSTGYGLGWEVSTVKGHADVHHNGAMNGFVGNISRFTDDRLTVIALVNQSGLSNTERISTGVARLYIPAIRPVPHGEQAHPAKMATAALDAIAGRYEYWGNFMLTLRPGNGVLLGQLPVGEADDYVPISAGSFWQAEDGVELTVIRNAGGDVTGLRVRQDDGGERTIPRIGPLFSGLSPQADPDPARTQMLQSTLQLLARGGKAVDDSATIAPSAKPDFLSGTTDFHGLRSISYVAAHDVAGPAWTRHGAEIGRVIYYRLITDHVPENLIIYLTSEGRLADYDIVDN